jgi:nucleotide-binding universal stress UspA family protein
MSIHELNPVVVGVDGSLESRAAVDVAGWEAHRRRLPLSLVQAATDAQRARERLEREEARLRDRYPGLCVSATVVAADPGTVLVDRSRSAALVVVGARGLGSFHSALPGSVAVHVARHSRAPAVVVRPPGRYARRVRAGVVVGIGGSAGTTAAVEFAFDAAAARATDLVAVCAWTPGPGDPRGAADRLLAAALGGWPDKYPQVELMYRVQADRNPLRALLEAAADAELVVCGGGPLAAGLVDHAETSVAVVPVAPE